MTRRRRTDFSQEAWRMVRALSVELVRSAAELGSARATFQGVELQAMRLNGQGLLGSAPARVHLCLWRGQQPIDSTVTAVHVASIEPALETASEIEDDS